MFSPFGIYKCMWIITLLFNINLVLFREATSVLTNLESLQILIENNIFSYNITYNVGIIIIIFKFLINTRVLYCSTRFFNTNVCPSNRTVTISLLSSSLCNPFYITVNVYTLRNAVACSL